MKIVYLHIGMPKTGTSAIQRFLTDNPEVLAGKGYCYRHLPYSFPDRSSPRRNAHFLVENIYNGKGKLDLPTKRARMEDTLRIIAQWLEEFDHIILTDEAIWNNLRGDTWEDFARLKKFCQEQGAALKIIVYLRRQDEYMLSWWKQHIRDGGKNGRLPDWETFTEKLHKLIILDYEKHLREIEQYIPREDLIVRIYDRNGFVGKTHTIYSDFLDAIGLEFTEEFVIGKAMVNVSLTNDYAEIKRLLNRLQGREYNRARNDISNFFERPAVKCSALSGYEERYSLLTEEQSVSIMAKYAASNAKLLERYFPGRAALFGKKMFPKEKWTPDNPQLLESIILYFGELALIQNREIQALYEKVNPLRNREEKEPETEKGIHEDRGTTERMRKKRKIVYLHIGLPKTGTSALQKFLTENQDVLAKKGYCYRHMPYKYSDKALVRRNAHFLVENLYDENGSPDPAAKKARIEDSLHIIAQWMKKFDRILLTDEALWNNLHGDNWEDFARLVQFCKEQGASLKIIVYLRRQDEYMLSWWKQHIRYGGKRGRLPDWDVFVEKLHKVLVLDYAKHLREIEQYIPKEDMIVRIYDRNGFVGKNHTIYSDFLDAVGLEFTDQFSINEMMVNISLTDDYAEIKRLLNGLQDRKCNRSRNEVSNFFECPATECSALSDFHEKYSLLTEEQSVSIMAKYEASNAEVLERYFPGRAELFGKKTFSKEKWTMENPQLIESVILYFGALALMQNRKIQSLNDKVNRLLNPEEEEPEKKPEEDPRKDKEIARPEKKILKFAKRVYKKLTKKA